MVVTCLAHPQTDPSRLLVESYEYRNYSVIMWAKMPSRHHFVLPAPLFRFPSLFWYSSSISPRIDSLDIGLCLLGDIKP